MADRDRNDRTNANTAGFGTTGAAGTSASGASLRRLSELGDYEVADGHPDIRGWTVRTPDGQVLGKVDDLIVSVSEMRVRYLDVDVDHSVRSAIADAAAPKGAEPGHALVPIGTARLDDGADGVVVSGLSGASLSSYPMYERQQGISREYEQALRGHLGAGTTGTEQADEFYAHEQYDDTQLFSGRRDRTGDEQRLTLSEEELALGKRKVQAGEVEVRKSVETEHVRDNVPVMREEVTIERRPVDDRMAAGEIGSDAAIRIPLTQEEVVVEKRPVVKEQIIVRKHAVTENHTVQADLKRERVDISGDARHLNDGSSDSRI